MFKVVGMTATTLEDSMRIVTINQVGTFLGSEFVVDGDMTARLG